MEELLEIFEQTEGPAIRALEAHVHWQTGSLPTWMRGVLIIGTACMGLACTAVRYYSKKCFTVRLAVHASLLDAR